MNKSTRKNKTNQVLNIPKTPYYTLRDLFAMNKHFNAEITIRVRHTALIEEGKAIAIGTIPGGKGRPSKVYSLTPVTQTTLNKAKANNIMLVDNADKLINVPVINVTSPGAAVNPVSSTTTPATVN